MTLEDKKVRAMGKPVSEEELNADLENYCRLARELGAADAVAIPASDVVIDERVRLKCLVPRCLRAGETPNCPPNAPELDLVRRAVSRYSRAVLLKCHVEPMEDYTPKKGGTDASQRLTLAYHRKSGDVVSAVERQAYKDGYHLAMGFGGGSCKDYLCNGLVCQVLDSGRCRFPQRSRPAMEAMGIDVVDLINKAGWDSYALLDDLSQIPVAVTIGIVFIK